MCWRLAADSNCNVDVAGLSRTGSSLQQCYIGGKVGTIIEHRHTQPDLADHGTYFQYWQKASSLRRILGSASPPPRPPVKSMACPRPDEVGSIKLVRAQGHRTQITPRLRGRLGLSARLPLERVASSDSLEKILDSQDMESRLRQDLLCTLLFQPRKRQ